MFCTNRFISRCWCSYGTTRKTSTGKVSLQEGVASFLEAGLLPGNAPVFNELEQATGVEQIRLCTPEFEDKQDLFVQSLRYLSLENLEEERVA